MKYNTVAQYRSRANIIHPSSVCKNSKYLVNHSLFLPLAALAVCVMLFSNSAQAGNLHILLNGKSDHTNQKTNQKYNEENWGGGFQYEFSTVSARWVPYVTMSGFVDSNNNPSYYMGYGLSRRYIISHMWDHLHVSVGGVGFMMTREDYHSGRPFIGALPVLTFGNDKIAVNITYIPEVSDKMTSLWFFQLKLSPKNFKI